MFYKIGQCLRLKISCDFTYFIWRTGVPTHFYSCIYSLRQGLCTKLQYDFTVVTRRTYVAVTPVGAFTIVQARTAIDTRNRSARIVTFTVQPCILRSACARVLVTRMIDIGGATEARRRRACIQRFARGSGEAHGTFTGEGLCTVVAVSSVQTRVGRPAEIYNKKV